MSKRSWIKLYCERTLDMLDNGWSTCDIGVWNLLLCIAGDGTYGDIGVIAIDKKRGLTDEQIASKLQFSRRNWHRYKDRFVTAKMITVHGNNVIEITNWKQYQSEYSRQKSYRFEQPQSYKGSYKPKLHPEKEKENREVRIKRKEKEKKKIVDNSTLKKNKDQELWGNNKKTGLTSIKDIEPF